MSKLVSGVVAPFSGFSLATFEAIDDGVQQYTLMFNDKFIKLTLFMPSHKENSVDMAEIYFNVKEDGYKITEVIDFVQQDFYFNGIKIKLEE